MTDQHPITPPPQLVEQWRTTPEHVNGRSKIVLVSMTTSKLQEIADCAARWGADQELEACCEWLHWQKLVSHVNLIACLRAARRPKPPSLKEQALIVLDDISHRLDAAHENTIRRALEALPNG